MRFNEISSLLKEHYDLGNALEINKNRNGKGDNYEVLTKKAKVFLKFFDEKDGQNCARQEPDICNLLSSNGIPCCKFIKNKEGNYITSYDIDKIFHVKYFIEGKSWTVQSGSEWLMDKSLALLCNINNVLKSVNLEYSPKFANINNTPQHLNKLQYLVDKASESSLSDKEEVISLLNYKKFLIINSLPIDLTHLSWVNSNADFDISQMITKSHQIIAVTDFSELFSVPANWQIAKFYLHSAQEICNGKLSIQSFKRCLKKYQEFTYLNANDLKTMLDIYILQQAESTHGFKEYILFNDNSEFKVVKARLKVYKYIVENKEAINEYLIH